MTVYLESVSHLIDNMRFLLCIIVVFVLVTACQSIQEPEKPENFIPQEKMERILYDVALINAARGYSVQRLKKNNVSPDTYIFEKYNIDSLQYAKNTAYYSANIDRYKSMHSAVEKDVLAMSDSLKLILEIRKKEEDSLRNLAAKKKKKRDSLKKPKMRDNSVLKPTGSIPFSVKEVLRDSI